MGNNSPLVSVFIVTYNSEDYIVETLDSVKAQTYQNIELVVSDDKSQDSTVMIVREWLKHNATRFVRTQLVETLINTGTSGNYNRAVEACNGEWLKMLDGDDVLLPECIQDYINFIEQTAAEVVFSNYNELYCGKLNKIVHSKSRNKMVAFGDLDALEQFKFLLFGNILVSSTCFVKSSILKNNKYDENYTLLEDYPMWLKLLEQGIKFFYMDKCTVLYRKANSVSSNNVVLFPVYYTNQCRRFFYNYQYDQIKKYELKEAYQRNRRYYFWFDLCEVLLRNKRNIFSMPLCKMFKYIVFSIVRFKL